MAYLHSTVADFHVFSSREAGHRIQGIAMILPESVGEAGKAQAETVSSLNIS